MSPRAVLGAPWPAWKHGVVAGVGVAVLGAALTALPWFWPLQESFDLWVLFRLRGPQAPPDDIVLVTIDQQSSERIALPADPEARERCLDLRVGETPASHERLPPPHLVMRWPRCLHGLAVRALAAGGARVIALDISFRPLAPPGSDNEPAFGRRAGPCAGGRNRVGRQRAARTMARSDRGQPSARNRQFAAAAGSDQSADRIGRTGRRSPAPRLGPIGKGQQLRRVQRGGSPDLQPAGSGLPSVRRGSPLGVRPSAREGQSRQRRTVTANGAATGRTEAPAGDLAGDPLPGASRPQGRRFAA